MRVELADNPILGYEGQDNDEHEADHLADNVVQQSELLVKVDQFPAVKRGVLILTEKESNTKKVELRARHALQQTQLQRQALIQRTDGLDASDGPIDKVNGRDAIIKEFLKIMDLFDKDLSKLLSLEILREAESLDDAAKTFLRIVSVCLEDVTEQEKSAEAKVNAAKEKLDTDRKCLGDTLHCDDTMISERHKKTFETLMQDQRKLTELQREHTEKTEQRVGVVEIQRCAKDVCKKLDEQSTKLKSLNGTSWPQAVADHRHDVIKVCELLQHQFGSLSRVIRALLLVGPTIGEETGYSREVTRQTIESRNGEFKHHTDELQKHVDNLEATTAQDIQLKYQAKQGLMLVSDMRSLLSLYASNKNGYIGENQNLQPHGKGTLTFPEIGTPVCLSSD
jgi:hypothetical protein